ncbi:hypothetical protein BJX63DRAFT_298746 [Aspergillus granulosus]|uniref:Uncharacterized protein n=1 Tax=Aspergillus granulosus TaxID=176169 RepID=A0ABR4H6B5_9EURO
MSRGDQHLGINFLGISLSDLQVFSVTVFVSLSMILFHATWGTWSRPSKGTMTHSPERPCQGGAQRYLNGSNDTYQRKDREHVFGMSFLRIQLLGFAHSYQLP